MSTVFTLCTVSTVPRGRQDYSIFSLVFTPGACRYSVFGAWVRVCMLCAPPSTASRWSIVSRRDLPEGTKPTIVNSIEVTLDDGGDEDHHCHLGGRSAELEPRAEWALAADTSWSRHPHAATPITLTAECLIRFLCTLLRFTSNREEVVQHTRLGLCHGEQLNNTLIISSMFLRRRLNDRNGLTRLSCVHYRRKIWGFRCSHGLVQKLAAGHKMSFSSVHLYGSLYIIMATWCSILSLIILCSIQAVHQSTQIS